MMFASRAKQRSEVPPAEVKRLDQVDDKFDPKYAEPYSLIFKTSGDKQIEQLQQVAAEAMKSCVMISCFENGVIEVYQVGSGFAVADDLVLTNYHVIDSADRIFVRPLGPHTYPAVVVYSNKDVDLALLKIEVKLQPLEFGLNSRVRQGQPVAAIGAPLGHELTVSMGTITSVEPHPHLMDGGVTMVNSRVVITRGSSGSVLINSKGVAIGLCSHGNMYYAVCYAISCKDMKKFYRSYLSELKRQRRSSIKLPPVREELGIETVETTLPGGSVILHVVSVDKQSKLWNHVRDGDVLVNVNSKSIKSRKQLDAQLGKQGNFRLEILRNKRSLEVQL